MLLSGIHFLDPRFRGDDKLHSARGLRRLLVPKERHSSKKPHARQGMDKKRGASKKNTRPRDFETGC
jgi:hypothetical protein